jgi:hypothetical protein
MADVVQSTDPTPHPFAAPIDLPSSDPWVMKVWSFRLLEAGWNGGRAPAPSPSAIANAIRFLVAMATANCQPTRVAPSAVGGVAITRRFGDRKAVVEFFNDDTASGLLADDASQNMQIHKIAITPQGFDEILDLMREYVDA